MPDMPNLALVHLKRIDTGYPGSKLLTVKFSNKQKLFLKYYKYTRTTIKGKKLLTVASLSF